MEMSHPPDMARVRYGEHQVTIRDVFTPLRHDPKLISDCAILSAGIYSRDEKTSEAKTLPRTHFQWELFEEFEPPTFPRGIFILGGLGLEVWTTRQAESRPIAVLIFRGTRFTKFADWYSNLRWVTQCIPRVWDQYREAQARVPAIVNALSAKFGNDLKVITAGHSLGGGLAQHAGYSTYGISNVYAFNPSPVTGFYSIQKHVREKNVENLKVLRMYEHGEILAYVRLIIRLFSPLRYRDPSIIEIRFNFGTGNAVSEHGMITFARGLQAIQKRLQEHFSVGRARSAQAK
jgi:hypothetical protein